MGMGAGVGSSTLENKGHLVLKDNRRAPRGICI